MCVQSNCLLSDVDVKLSSVNVLFAEINQLMSSRPVPLVQSRTLLPRVETILSEINWFVRQAQQDVKEDVESLDYDTLVFTFISLLCKPEPHSSMSVVGWQYKTDFPTLFIYHQIVLVYRHFVCFLFNHKFKIKPFNA